MDGQQNNNTFQPQGGYGSKASKNKVLIPAIIGIILLILVLGFVYCYITFNNPAKFFNRVVSYSSKALTKNSNQNSSLINKKVEVNLNCNFDLKNASSDQKDLEDTLNNSNIKLVHQINDKYQTQLDFDIDSNNDDLIDGNIIVDLNKKMAYAKVSEIYSKYISFDLDDIDGIDDDTIDTLKDILDGSKSANTNKSIQIFSEELQKIIKKDYCSNSKSSVNYNGKNVSTTKFTLKMNSQQFVDELKSLLNNLMNNQNYLDCFEADSQSDIKNDLQNAIDTLDDSNASEDINIEFSMDASGLLKNNILKTELKVVDNDSDENYSIVIAKQDKNTYNYSFENSKDDSNNVSGTIVLKELKQNKVALQCSISSENSGTITLNIDSTVSDEVNIDKITKNNSVKSGDLTQSDYNEISENFQKSNLYKELLSSIMSSFNSLSSSSSSSNLNSSSSSSSNYNSSFDDDDNNYTTNSTYDDDDDYNYSYSSSFNSNDNDDDSYSSSYYYDDSDLINAASNLPTGR